MKYFLWIEGKETGPYEQRDVEAAVADESIYADTLARRETGISWDPIETLLPSVKDLIPVRKSVNTKTADVIETPSRPPAKAMSRLHGAFLTLLLLCVLTLLVWDFVKPPGRFEYRTVVVPAVAQSTTESREATAGIPGRVDEVALTELGGEGWELAGSYTAADWPKQATVDATADLAGNSVVLLFKRSERNPLVARYIDPLWRTEAKPEAKPAMTSEESDAKEEGKSEVKSTSKVDPLTDSVRELETKEVLPVR